MRKNKSTNHILFLIGLFSATQIRVVGSIGISELVIFIVAPFLFINNVAQLRRDGFFPLIWLSLLASFSCVMSSLYNNTPIPNLFRGVATCYSIFAYTVVFHKLLRDNLDGFKWVLLGGCFSGIINIFAFQQAVETFRAGVGASAEEQMDAITSGPLFWLSRVGPFLRIPSVGWYFETPLWFSILSAVIMPLFTAATTSSGRSALALGVGVAAMYMIGKKSRSAMDRMQKNIIFLCVCAIVLMICLKQIYVFLGEHQMLNEEANKKYEAQMHSEKGAKGLIGMLVSGRSEFFMGLYFASHRPFWGYGPWAYDDDGLIAEYLRKYGNDEDYELIMKSDEYRQSVGRSTARLMPAHSYIVGFWVYYGLLAVPVWIYGLMLMYRLCRYNLSVVPQLYGFFASALVGHFWNIFFSPYSSRLGTPLFFVMILFVDAIRRGKMQMPVDLYIQAQDPKYR
jgi:hypothetical protein